MKNIRLTGLVSMLMTCFLYGLAHADKIAVSTPRNQQGFETNPLYSGAKYTNLTTTTEVMITTGPAVVYGVILSTGLPTQFVIIRDTAALNGSGTQVIPNIQFSVGVTSGANTTQGNFPIPVRMTKGITAKLGATPTTGENATLLWLNVAP